MVGGANSCILIAVAAPRTAACPSLQPTAYPCSPSYGRRGDGRGTCPAVPTRRPVVLPMTAPKGANKFGIYIATPTHPHDSSQPKKARLPPEELVEALLSRAPRPLCHVWGVCPLIFYTSLPPPHIIAATLNSQGCRRNRHQICRNQIWLRSTTFNRSLCQLHLPSSFPDRHQRLALTV